MTSGKVGLGEELTCCCLLPLLSALTARLNVNVQQIGSCNVATKYCNMPEPNSCFLMISVKFRHEKESNIL